MQTKIAETPNDSVVGKTTQISSGISADSSIPQSGENVNPTGVSVTEMQQSKGINVRTYESDNEESRLETLNKLDGVRFSKDVDTEADSKITQYDIEQLRSIGRKSIFDFTHEDIQKSDKWAKKFYAELGAKSPFFRAWFGDWRANDTEKINIVSVPTIDIKDATLEYGDYHINDTGWDVYAGRTLKDDTTHHSGGERINVKSLNSIESILQNAVLFDTVVSENNTNKKAKYTAFLHKLYTPITYNNSEYIAVTTVEEYYNESVNDFSKRAYNLKSIKIEPADGRLEKISTSPMSGTGSTISISDLYSLVKSNDKNFKEIPASKVVNEDGTPKVMYHGTSSFGFTVFDYSHQKFGLFGVGSYFTDDIDVATSYTEKGKGNSKGVYAVYLNIKNPLDMDKNANVSDWNQHAPDAEGYFNNCQTNEDCFKALKEYCADEYMTKYEVDELLKTAKSFINEEAVHKKKFDNFARGEIRFKVGNNGYAAEILVGIRRNQNAELYDIVNIVPIKITENSGRYVTGNTVQAGQKFSADTSLPQSGESVNRTGESVTEMKQSNGEIRNSKDVFTQEEREKIISKGYTDYLARQFVVKDKSGEHAKAVFPLKNNHKQMGACRFVPEIDCTRFYCLFVLYSIHRIAHSWVRFDRRL